MMRAAARIGSAVSCGIAPCPPRPSTSIANSSTAAMSAPRLTPILPTGSGFQRWRPRAAVTPSRTPSPRTPRRRRAPSSAGWKRNGDRVPAERADEALGHRERRSRRGRRGRRRASGRELATRTGRRSPRRAGVRPCRRAAGAGRRPGPGPPMTPVLPTPVRGREPEPRQPVRDDSRRARLLEAELGVRGGGRAASDEATRTPPGETRRGASNAWRRGRHGADYREPGSRHKTACPTSFRPSSTAYIRDLLPPRTR